MFVLLFFSSATQWAQFRLVSGLASCSGEDRPYTVDCKQQQQFV